MGDYRIEYLSPDKQVRAEGFTFRCIIKNNELFQKLLEYSNYIRLGLFRLLPGHIAHRDRHYEETKDVHYLYLKENLGAENSEESELEREVSEEVLETVS